MRLKTKVNNWMGWNSNRLNLPRFDGLEQRDLLSAAVGSTAVVAAASTAAPVGHSVVVHAIAGIHFTGDVATITGLVPATTPLFSLRVSIDWGDKTPDSPGILVLDPKGIVHVVGGHTFSKTGTDTVTVQIFQLPPPPPPPSTGSVSTSTTPTPPAPKLLLQIISSAVVTQNSLGGVTVDATTGVSFTKVIGHFNPVQPPPPPPNAVNPPTITLAYTAVINWGDGTVSIGRVVLTSTGAYNVFGTHTYAKAGDYRVVINVQAKPVPVSGETTPPLVINLPPIFSTADVTDPTAA